MKILFLVLTIASTFIFSQVNAQCCTTKKSVSSSDKILDIEGSETIKLKVTGMTCAGCATQVHKVLNEAPGVLDNFVEYPGDIAVVQYNPDETKPELIIEIIEKRTAYKAELITDLEKKKS